MHCGLAMSVVLALAGAGICPTVRAQDRIELQTLVADNPVALTPAFGEGPTATAPGFCPASPPWTGQHVLGGVTVSELTFNSGLHLAHDDQQKIASSIRQHTYFGDPAGAAAGILERVRAAWQDHGFFKAQVHGDTRIVADSALDIRIALAIQIDEGPQYRLRQITFKGNRLVLNAQALRKLFPLQDGQLFSRSAIGHGLDNLRTAYRSSGFINFTSIPNSDVDEQSRTIALAIDMDEGRQFLVSGIRIIGLDEFAAENALKDLSLKRGEVYNEKLADLFLLTEGSWLPSGASPESRIHLELNERAGTVAVAFDFAPCPIE